MNLGPSLIKLTLGPSLNPLYVSDFVQRPNGPSLSMDEWTEFGYKGPSINESKWSEYKGLSMDRV